ncbi:MAG: site-2 protease family protein [Haloarculaceae archaeon]
MDESRVPADAPPLSDVASVFDVADVRVADGTIYYLGTPMASSETLRHELWPLFHEAGYEVSLSTRAQVDGSFDDVPGTDGQFSPLGPQYVLVAEPRSPYLDGVPWLNILSLLATVLSTLWVGASLWYHVRVDSVWALLGGWRFAAAVLGVLAVHEMGHYVMIRYYDVDASLPYFIPFPSLIGTMGAVIRMRGKIPSRKALFDIGVAGPLAGLAATVVVTVIGLHLDPIAVPVDSLDGKGAVRVEFNYPPLLLLLGELTGQPLSYPSPRLAPSPVIFGGWVGMFVTFLNLLPVGQFDGGHVVRGLLGPRQESVAAAVPVALFSLSGYLYVVSGWTNAVFLWGFWGVIAVVLAYAGPATPVRDDPIGPKRKAVGVLTLVLGLLCFTPVPIEVAPV